jgi:hypothetical protein
VLDLKKAINDGPVYPRGSITVQTKPTKERGREQIILFFKMLKISKNIYLSKKKNLPRKLKKLEVLRNI